MNILFFDTETTGVPLNYKAPVTDLNNWPRLVQLGYITYETDGIEVFKSFEQEYVVRPDGFEISEQVSKIHGVTQEKALTTGEDIKEVLYHFRNLVEWSDLIVGHNLNFDLNVVGAEYLRLMQTNPFDGKKVFDTMLNSTNLCKLPGVRGSYKWPKLQELYQFLFHEPLAQTHTALDDIQNTAKCYFEMKRLGYGN